MNKNPLQHLLNHQSFVILDGGLATELERKGANLNDPLWSAKILYEQPNIIYEVAYEYLEAGADIIASASYQASIPGFLEKGFSEETALSLIQKSVSIAVQARDDFWKKLVNRIDRVKPLVAASIGPYGAYLADGSEYRGNYKVDVPTLTHFHQQRLEILSQSRADLIAFETFPDLREAHLVMQLLEKVSAKVAWLSLTLKDATHISDGYPLASAISELSKYPQLAAIGFNCVPPHQVSEILKPLKKITTKPLLVYPNNTGGWDAAQQCWIPNKDDQPFESYALEWYQFGANIIGGCCHTGPKEIQRVRKVIQSEVR